MPRLVQRRALTGAVRREAKRRKSSGTRWMHLSADEVRNRSVLQRITAIHLFCLQASSAYVQKLLLLHYLLRHQLNGTEQQIGIITNALRLSQVNLLLYFQHVRRFFYLDAFLHDITPLELAQIRALTVRRNICLAS